MYPGILVPGAGDPSCSPGGAGSRLGSTCEVLSYAKQGCLETALTTPQVLNSQTPLIHKHPDYNHSNPACLLCISPGLGTEMAWVAGQKCRRRDLQSRVNSGQFGGLCSAGGGTTHTDSGNLVCSPRLRDRPWVASLHHLGSSEDMAVKRARSVPVPGSFLKHRVGGPCTLEKGQLHSRGPMVPQ